MGLFLPFVRIKGLTQSQIVPYTLFDLAESNQFKFIFTMNHGSNAWFFLWFAEHYKSVYCIESNVSLFYCVFGSKKTIYCLTFAESMDLLIVNYWMNFKSDALYLYWKDHLAIVLFTNFTLSSKVDCLIIYICLRCIF